MEVQAMSSPRNDRQQLLDQIAELQAALTAARRVNRVDEALARQLARAMQENARLRQRIAELEGAKNA